MRKKNTQPIQDVMQEVVRALGIEQKLLESRLTRAWPSVVGKHVANATTSLNIHNRVLFVHTSSSIVRNELKMIRTGLVKKLNEAAGNDVIDEMVVR